MSDFEVVRYGVTMKYHVLAELPGDRFKVRVDSFNSRGRKVEQNTANFSRASLEAIRG